MIGYVRWIGFTVWPYRWVRPTKVLPARAVRGSTLGTFVISMATS